MTAKQRPREKPNPVPSIEECEAARTTLDKIRPFLKLTHDKYFSTSQRLQLIDDFLVEFLNQIEGIPSELFVPFNTQQDQTP